MIEVILWRRPFNFPGPLRPDRPELLGLGLESPLPRPVSSEGGPADEGTSESFVYVCICIYTHIAVYVYMYVLYVYVYVHVQTDCKIGIDREIERWRDGEMHTWIER